MKVLITGLPYREFGTYSYATVPSLTFCYTYISEGACTTSHVTSIECPRSTRDPAGDQPQTQTQPKISLSHRPSLRSASDKDPA